MNFILKLRIAILFVFLGICGSVLSQTSLEGKVIDKATQEPILFGTVALLKDGNIVNGAETDLDGNYYFSGMEAGEYDIEVSYVGYTTQRQTGVVIITGKTNRINFELQEGIIADEIVITAYKAPLIEIDNTTSGATVTSLTIKSLGTKDITQIAARSAGVSTDDNGNISVRGSRSNATFYYVDNMPINSGNRPPETEIEQLQVITGGFPAQFGDVTGGIISIVSKSVSEKLEGGFEIESSEFLDNFGYNQVRGNISVPLVKKDRFKLGLRAAGDFLHISDDDPTIVPIYAFDENTIANLNQNPTTRLANGSVFPSVEFLSGNDLTRFDSHPNNAFRRAYGSFKLQGSINNRFEFTLWGNYQDNKDHIYPDRFWQLLNWQNNPISETTGSYFNGKIRHKISHQSTDDKEGSSKKRLFENAFYQLQVGYDQRESVISDATHGDNLFEYGYIGRQVTNYLPVASEVSDPDNYQGQIVFDPFGQAYSHLGYEQIDQPFEPSTTINSTLAKLINNVNGTLESPFNQAWGNLYPNVGQLYNNYLFIGDRNGYTTNNAKQGFSQSESYRFRTNLDFGVDFIPGSSDKGRHSIQFGATYEQSLSRAYTLTPSKLWELAKLNANRRIIGVDINNPIGTFIQQLPGGNAQFVQYQTLLSPAGDELFYSKIRELTGQSENDYVNVEALDPSQLSIDMFSASELNNANVLGNFGYDHTGQKLGSDVTFEDFFTATDGERRTFPVAAYNPIYGAAYIQDKFSFKDIIFKIGVRVDYFDNNTKVLKDPFSLYEIETAQDFFARTGEAKPANIGDDYRVYIESEESTNVKGYRLGEQWYLPNGTPVSGGGDIFGGGVVTPSVIRDAEGNIPNIQSRDFDINSSFEDYDVQINVMPRLAFSFPISEESNFFAHYDVLVQRPSGVSYASPLDYFYFNDANRTPGGNPALKPEKTIDYEVGFQQKLTNTSAIKLSAYYKDLRDMIQSRVLLFTYPITQYDSFGNIDFGTVKGFSFGFDQRRVNNFEFLINYTLQFADGSGSTARSSSALNERGDIRAIFPLNFDERHRFNLSMDYRFGEGSDYNGPRAGDSEILSNTGLNVFATAVSGRPYTQSFSVQSFGGSGISGGINESRLPFQFRIDARLNKTFKIRPKKENSPEMDVFFRVVNVLNTKNIVGVYTGSNDENDDGYLLSEFGQDRLSQIESNGQSVDNFIEIYNILQGNPDHFAPPRQMFIGARFDF